MSKHEIAPAKKEYQVWADSRVFQVIEADSPEEAVSLAKERPDSFEPCQPDIDNYRLLQEVMDVNSGEHIRVSRASPCQKCDWRHKADPYGSGEHWIYDGDDNFLASVAFVKKPDGIDEEKSKTLTEFIVRACNSHEELLDALQDANESLEDCYKTDPDAAGQHFGAALKERMQVAIAKAKSHEHSA